MKRILFASAAIVFLICLSACGNISKKTVEDSPSSGDASQAAESVDQSSESGSEFQWPEKYMGNLPAPQSKISMIERMDGTEKLLQSDTTTKPSSVNVIMNEMAQEEALDYYDQLKSAGFTINKDKKDDQKILLTGTLDDKQSLFLFNYEVKHHLGNVSVTFPSAVSGDD